jgi:hypothetical protein
MSLLAKVASTKKKRPRKTLLYGVHGIGKSSWAAKWPSPVFINLEDGLADLDVPAFPKPTDLQSAWAPIMEMGAVDASEHGFQTLVIDSVDWLERLIHQQIIRDHERQIKSIAEIPYGKGYENAAAMLSKLLTALDSVIDSGVHVLLLAHCAIQRFESPELESYDRYSPKLHNNSKGVGASSLIQEWCDEVLFANYKVYSRQTDEGFNRKRNLAVGDGARVLYTSERPTHLAKNRLGLPDEIPMTKDGFEYGDFLT